LNKDEVPQLVKSVQLIESKIKEINIEIEHAKLQEAALNKAGEDTASRLEMFSWLSIVVLLGTAIWQIIYLRTFFTSKKLL
jgi:p24 family protein delta-1